MIPIINSNVISSMKVLIEQGEHMGLVDESISSDTSIIKALGDDAAIDSTLASVLEQLWNSGTIQQVFEQRHKFQLPDSAKYYFNKVLEIGNAEYIPSVQDVLRSRVRTSGIVEERYLIDNVPFHMYDVGGQRNERKKWILQKYSPEAWSPGLAADAWRRVCAEGARAVPHDCIPDAG